MRICFPGTDVLAAVLVHKIFLSFDQWLKRILETRIARFCSFITSHYNPKNMESKWRSVERTEKLTAEITEEK